jgi:hypothetical protein
LIFLDEAIEGAGIAKPTPGRGCCRGLGRRGRLIRGKIVISVAKNNVNGAVRRSDFLKMAT